MKHLFTQRQRTERLWLVTWDSERRVRLTSTGEMVVRRTLLLKAAHVGFTTPSCGRITTQDVAAGRRLVLDEDAQGNLIDWIVDPGSAET